MHFGTGHAIHITEHDENLPFTVGVGIGRPDIILRRFSEAVFNIRFHFASEFVETASGATLRNVRVTNRIDADNEKFPVSCYGCNINL